MLWQQPPDRSMRLAHVRKDYYTVLYQLHRDVEDLQPKRAVPYDSTLCRTKNHELGAESCWGGRNVYHAYRLIRAATAADKDPFFVMPI